MTDKTDALLAPKLRNIISGYRINEDDAGWLMGLLTSRAERPAGAVGDATFAEWLATEMPAGTVIGDPQWWANRIARQYRVRSAAPPAASVDVGRLAEEYAEYFNTVRLPHQVQEFWDKLRALIDSAGGAKGECRHEWINSDGVGGKARKNLHCAKCGKSRDTLTPKPDGGDGAVAAMEAWHSVLDEAGELFCNAPDTRYANRASRVVTWIKANRPSAAAAVPELERRHVERAIRVLRRDYESPLADAVESIYKQMLAAAPAAPKGGVVDALCREARELQRKNYGSGAGLHLDMIDWARKYDAALANQEQRHDALADGQAASD